MMSLSSLSPRETVSTSLHKKSISFKWTIMNAKMCFKFKELESPKFSVALQDGVEYLWYLKASDMSYEETTITGRLSLKSSEENCHDCSVLVTSYRNSILNPETQRIVHSVCTDEVVEHIPWFRGDLSNAICVSIEDLYNDTLCIQMEADLSFIVHKVLDVPDNREKGIHNLYKNEVLTDTIIKCEDKEFKVHRAVLASQSPVFRAMFEVDMKEKQSGVIEVSGITPAVMSDLVAYLYTGTAPNLKTLASELLDVAEKYEIPRLFNMCENELKSRIEAANVIETLLLADLYGRACLKKACLEFICLHSTEVCLMATWATLKDQYPPLYIEVLEYLNVFSESS